MRQSTPTIRHRNSAWECYQFLRAAKLKKPPETATTAELLEKQGNSKSPKHCATGFFVEIGGTWNTWDTYDEVWDTREKYTLSPKPGSRTLGTLVTRWTLRSWLSERAVTPLALNLPSRRLLHLVANGHKLLRGIGGRSFHVDFGAKWTDVVRLDVCHPWTGMSLFIQRVTFPKVWSHQVLTLYPYSPHYPIHVQISVGFYVFLRSAIKWDFQAWIYEKKIVGTKLKITFVQLDILDTFVLRRLMTYVHRLKTIWLCCIIFLIKLNTCCLFHKKLVFNCILFLTLAYSVIWESCWWYTYQHWNEPLERKACVGGRGRLTCST